MDFFIDTADVAEIQQAKEFGILDGVTTNPSLIAKSGRNFEEVAREIIGLVDGPVSVEVTGTTKADMLEEAQRFAAWGDNVVIKLPLIEEGLKACQALTQEGVKTNVTLCFSATQGLLAAKAGATYISPFIGRIDDISYQGMDLIRELRIIYDNYGFQTKILAASIRNPLHVKEAALVGADVSTIPFKVLSQLASHPLTDIGLERFLKDWQKVEGKA